MPKQRRSLTRGERMQNRKIEKRLITAGALDSSSSELTDPEWIRISHCLTASYVRASPLSSIFVIHARIVALATMVIIQDFVVWSPVMDLVTWLVRDPMLNRSDQTFYHSWDGSRFHRNEVLNHRVDKEGVLRRGDVLEGVVIAESFKGIPSCFGVTYRLPLCLSIVNQFDYVRKLTIELPVERVTRRLRPRSISRGLFGSKYSKDSSPQTPEHVIDAPDRSSVPLDSTEDLTPRRRPSSLRRP
jgi:hypothetical protein